MFAAPGVAANAATANVAAAADTGEGGGGGQAEPLLCWWWDVAVFCELWGMAPSGFGIT